ncbi:MAG: hypothetical protein JSS61_02515 [Verrucomicrobia bacterium]|nr:hypothetical protein [Verrucomicrobiota bacterium]
MMKYTLLLLSLIARLSADVVDLDAIAQKDTIVLQTKRIYLPNYPDAFNPSIIRYGDGYLLTFRYCPDVYYQPWIALIGILLLDENLEPISEPQLISPRSKFTAIPPQGEDVRVFSYRDRLFLIYNDNDEMIYPSPWDRRDMYMAELYSENGYFSLSKPIKLIHEEKYNLFWWQKNWTPFEWKGRLLITYSINPHEILTPNLMSGICFRCYETPAPIEWEWGHPLRCSTPPQLVDGEYLSFFHSWTVMHSTASDQEETFHYFMGAFTFSAEPPFQITKAHNEPIIGKGFYTNSHCFKRVIFPGGFVVAGDVIHLAYGKDDCEMWIATLDKKALMESLHPIKSQ